MQSDIGSIKIIITGGKRYTNCAELSFGDADTLTLRECAVLALLPKGIKEKELALVFGISCPGVGFFRWECI